eukprot:TRINITY_DN6354_c0_g1_i1.p1 TRINITY_DN6354_c0_g1~~TRINITY_DN6354_c0_g1_i1.p1  ORF type:complete len:715 (-),score=211.62 TRINITY_DN6354_c0_g1_i1:176-2320(-)
MSGINLFSEPVIRGSQASAGSRQAPLQQQQQQSQVAQALEAAARHSQGFDAAAAFPRPTSSFDAVRAPQGHMMFHGAAPAYYGTAPQVQSYGSNGYHPGYTDYSKYENYDHDDVENYRDDDYYRDRREAEWQQQMESQYFSRWGSDKVNDWEAYQTHYDTAAREWDDDKQQRSSRGPDDVPTPARAGGATAQVEDAKAAAEYRRRHEMQVINAFTEGSVPAPVQSFQEACLPYEVLQEIQEAKFERPTPIQAQCWPILSAGQDLIGIAKSGSGKTLAFLAPAFAQLLQRACDVASGPQVLVLAPTRELARQIQMEALKFGRSSGILSCALTGGESKADQLEWIQRGCHVLVATPGRLNELLEKRHVSLGQVFYAVLDEADKMLDMGFEPQIRRIIKEAPAGPERQTLLFSATWPKAVRKLAFDFLKRPLHVQIGEMSSAKANSDINQQIVVVDRSDDKNECLVERLRQLKAETMAAEDDAGLAIIFVARKFSCEELARYLKRSIQGLDVVTIHGDKDQRERDTALHGFTQKKKHVLVATDVASRGLDIKGVKLVVNYDPANTPEDYVHRIGRTGRAGQKGTSLTFLVRGLSEDIKKAKSIEQVIATAGQEVPKALTDYLIEHAAAGKRPGKGSRRKGGGKGGQGFFGGSGGQDHFSNSWKDAGWSPMPDMRSKGKKGYSSSCGKGGGKGDSKGKSSFGGYFGGSNYGYGGGWPG